MADAPPSPVAAASSSSAPSSLPRPPTRLSRTASQRAQQPSRCLPRVSTKAATTNPTGATNGQPASPATSPQQQQQRVVSRVRSDSALASLRRRHSSVDGCVAPVTPSFPSSLPQGGDLRVGEATQGSPSLAPRGGCGRRQRLSLGVTTLGPKFGLHHKRADGFFDVFGLLGVPMVACFAGTAIAVLSQAYIQVDPVAFANYLMDTKTYDDGEFWMLPDSDLAPTVVATALLIAFAVCYVYLAAFMLFFRHKAVLKKPPQAQPPLVSPRHKPGSSGTPSSKTRTSSASAFASSTNRDGSSRASSLHVKLKPKFPELNGIQLLKLMLPLVLWPSTASKTMVAVPDAATTTTTSTANASSRGNSFRANSFRSEVVPVEDQDGPPDKGQVPAKTLDKPSPRIQKYAQPTTNNSIPLKEIYHQFVSPDGVYNSYYNVLYDTPKLVFQSITLLAYLRKGFPIPLTAFYASMLTFNYLISFYRFQRKRIDHGLLITRFFYLFDLFFAAFAPIVVLCFAYYSFHFDRQVYNTKAETMAPGVFDRNARLFADPYEMSVFRLAFGSIRLTTDLKALFTKCSLLLLSVFKWRKIIVYLIQVNHAKQRQIAGHHGPKNRKHSSSRRHLFCGMLLFVFFGSGIVLYTTGSIYTSLAHCTQYEHCLVVSYHWTFANEGCPCLVYINRQMAPRTFASWVSPPDVTEELNELAEMGELKVIQIINRALPTLPPNLRKCHKLEQIILMYAKTEIIPEWTKELVHLQYFHIEGDRVKSLTSLPLDTFSHMNKLQYLHTGVIPRLTSYPSLSGLVKLKTLVIASPHSLKELPSFDNLVSLRVLLLVECTHIARLPSLQKLVKLVSFHLFYRAEMCCNGFLTPGKCDLATYQCKPRQDEPLVVCQSESIASQDVALLDKINANVCSNFQFDLGDYAPTKETTDDVCGGVLFRQCRVGNTDTTGICYNGRMQVVYCDASGDYERMRRLQIQRQVGIPCDSKEEAWLGCKV